MRIRSRLLLLMFGILVPILVFSGAMLTHFNQQTRRATEKGLVETARALSVAVDEQVAATLSVLQALATSEHLRTGDLREFDRAARAVLATQPTWQNIVLITPDGRQRINTMLPFDAALPSTANPELIARVVRTRAPAVSDLFMGRVSQRPVVLAVVPVVRHDMPVYVLGVNYSADALTNVLLKQKVPAEAIGTLLDGHKVIIGRTRAADRFVGQRETPDLAARMAEVAEGSFRLFTKDGQAIYAAISRSQQTGWTIALGVPQATADAPLHASLRLLFVVGTGSALLGLLLVAHGARCIANSIASLSAAAAAFVKGETVEFQRSAIAEVDEVTRAMEIASHERQQSEAAAAALVEVGRELVGTLDPAQAAHRIVATVAEVFQVRRADLYQVDAAAQDLVCVASGGDGNPERWVGQRMAKGRGVAGRAFAEERMISSPDITLDPNIALPQWVRERVEQEQFRAVTCVPLRVRQRVLGVLGLGYEAARVLTDKELRLLAAFADQAAVAFENARLHGDVRERLIQSETLLAVGQQVSGTLDLTEMMRLVSREACRALGADMVGAFLADADHGYLRPIAGYHVPKHLLSAFLESPIPLKGHRVLEEACAQRQAVAITDVAHDPRIDRDVLSRFPHRSALFCPMIVQGQPIGGLFVTWFERDHHFTPAELRLVEGISRQAAVGLANARLVDELKTRQASLETLLEMSRGLSRIQPVTSLLTSTAEACGRLLGTDSVGIRLVEGDDLVLAGAYGDAKQMMTKPRLKIGESFSGRVAASGEPLLILDPENDPRLIPEHRGPISGIGFRAWLGVPIKMGERLVGVLSIRTKRPEGFSAEDRAIVGAFAAQAAIALENSRLYQETQRALDELSRTQQQLTQAQKMEAIGQLAGGIAHDFNNLLTVIGGRSRLLLDRLSPDSPARRDIELIQKTGDRAAALTRQLLAFSRKQILQPKALDLNALVGGLAPMLTRLIGEHIELAIVPGKALAQVMADPGQLEQVIMNLLVNARDAMPEGGMIKIETANRNLETSPHHAQGQIPAGQYVTLVVQDTGRGMAADTLARIFEPFFTTKDLGKGTGLGLSTVYGIVHQSGGFIGVDSAPGCGSTFIVYLPRIAAAAQAPETQARMASLPQGHETILLVEDEPEVRQIASEILKFCGYTVLETGDSLEALLLEERHRGKIRLLLSDVVMPAMRGPMLAAQLMPLEPNMRVVYMSGYTDGPLGQDGATEGGAKFLQKPFTPESLSGVVREALDTVSTP